MAVSLPKNFIFLEPRRTRETPIRFVDTYYFDKLDLNHNRKTDQAEFAKMRDENKRKKQR